MCLAVFHFTHETFQATPIFSTHFSSPPHSVTTTDLAKMEVKIDQEIDIQTDEKAPLPIVIVDDEEKVILRKIDAQ